MRTLRGKILSLAAACLLTVSALAHPGSGILVDRQGQVFFIDTGSGLWKIDTKGGLTHLSPLRNHWLAMDPTDRFVQSRLPTDRGRDWEITAAGSNPTILISTDFPLVIGPNGDLYHPSVRETNVRIMRTSPTDGTSAFVKLPRSVAGASLGWINGLATGPDGSLYYTEDNAVRRITAKGQVSTVVTVPPLTNGPNIPGNDSRPYLRGLKVDAKGVVYVADSADARVLKIAPGNAGISAGKGEENVSTILQLESPWAPTDVAVFGDIVYVLEFSHDAGDDRTTWMPRVRKITPDGTSTVIVTVDQMPGARPSKPAAASVSYNLSWFEVLYLLLRSLI